MDIYRLRKRSGVQFNCFSPPVMLASFSIEIVLALYTLWRYKMNVLGRLVVASLVALAVFQLCEYHVCGGWGIRASEWSRAGFAAISFLPPLGLHMLHVLANKPRRKLVATAYLTMVGFVVYYLFNTAAFIGYQCTGNYVIFQIGTHATWAFGAYYYGWLGIAIVLGAKWANELHAAGKKMVRRLFAVRGLIIGYLVFLVPTAVANSVKPETRSGIPSIMCGFAVLFALILVLYILPRLGQQRAET